MSIELRLVSKVPARAELVGLAVTSDAVDEEPHGLDWKLLRASGFDGSVGQAEIVAGPERAVAVLGLGPAAELGSSAFRQAGAALVRAGARFGSLGADVLDQAGEAVDRAAAAQAFAEGIDLGVYEFMAHKSNGATSKVRSVALVGSGKRISAALDRGQAIARGVNLTRDLVNEPGGSLTPVEFARRAGKVARQGRLAIEVLDLAAIKKARLGGVLGVNRGSTQQPRFVRMTYKPSGRAQGHLALVGKGITFDAGGLSIKTSAGMMTMKSDKAGASAVLGAMAAIAELGPRIRVSAFMPLTDNMLGGDATRPGDVLKMRNKKTVEVLNTDAEGRLILADALSLASEAKPDAIIDLATLTGACVVALGDRYAGLMGTDGTGWLEQVAAAGERTGERVWRLPLPAEYRPQLDSNVADIKNIGGSNGGGALTAGLFLKEFVVEGIPWAHVDIAGPAFSDTPFEEHPKGATGFGVRLLVDLIENFQKPVGE